MQVFIARLLFLCIFLDRHQWLAGIVGEDVLPGELLAEELFPQARCLFRRLFVCLIFFEVEIILPLSFIYFFSRHVREN